MARPKKLETADIQRRLEALDGWSIHDDKLTREFRM